MDDVVRALEPIVDSLRARADIERIKRGRDKVVVTEIGRTAWDGGAQPRFIEPARAKGLGG